MEEIVREIDELVLKNTKEDGVHFIILPVLCDSLCKSMFPYPIFVMELK